MGLPIKTPRKGADRL